MGENLSTFLVDLASDPERLAGLMGSASFAPDDSALTAAERAAVRSGDGRQIRRALRLAPGANGESQISKKRKRPRRAPKRAPKRGPAKKKRPTPRKKAR